MKKQSKDYFHTSGILDCERYSVIESKVELSSRQTDPHLSCPPRVPWPMSSVDNHDLILSHHLIIISTWSHHVTSCLSHQHVMTGHTWPLNPGTVTPVYWSRHVTSGHVRSRQLTSHDERSRSVNTTIQIPTRQVECVRFSWSHGFHMSRHNDVTAWCETSLWRHRNVLKHSDRGRQVRWGERSAQASAWTYLAVRQIPCLIPTLSLTDTLTTDWPQTGHRWL